MMMASAKLVRDCSSELSSDVRSLSVASSTEEQDCTTTESEYSEEEKEYELEDLQILKTIGRLVFCTFRLGAAL
ncbi:jg18490 [Pararge aegeria aegeria]|uniref:Jg18490 protein n=1 Tax=Pararge aegeria aegeria TaxID=348720 RepID=A0A8S4RMF0_9NEOP|nr:jg18490 [Pararge aegeria aegeria]